MGLEPMTSPLPRECSTTELHQPAGLQFPQPLNPTAKSLRSFPLPRTQSCQHDSEREKTKQQPRQLLVLAGLHGTPDQYRQRTQHEESDNHATVAGWGKVHVKVLPLAAPALQPKKNGAQGRIRTSVTRRVADLQSAAINHSATCALVYVKTRTESIAPSRSRSQGTAGAQLRLAGGHCRRDDTQYNQTLQKTFAKCG
jgi:hypothetical protein